MRYCINYRRYNYDSFDITNTNYDDKEATSAYITLVSKITPYNDSEKEILEDYIGILQRKYELQCQYEKLKNLYSFYKTENYFNDAREAYSSLDRNSQAIAVYERDEEIKEMLLRMTKIVVAEQSHNTKSELSPLKEPQKNIITKINSVTKFCIGMCLLLAVLFSVGIADLDYGYYVFLRIFTFVALAIIIFAYSLDHDSFLNLVNIVFLVIMILFNPFFPIYLDKELWVILDIVSAVCMIGIGIYVLVKDIKSNDETT